MDEKFQLIFASLLRDIGKLGYRAGESGTHEEFGKKFVLMFDDIFPDVSSLISLHHQKDINDLFYQDKYIILKKLIIADWLASSERIEIKKGENVKKVGLTPIFSKISIYQKKNNQKFYYLAKQLALETNSVEIFPQKEEKVLNSLRINFTSNWSLFKKRFERIRKYKGNNEKIFEFYILS